MEAAVSAPENCSPRADAARAFAAGRFAGFREAPVIACARRAFHRGYHALRATSRRSDRIGLAVDHSGSMKPKLAEVINAARTFVQSSRQDDRMFVVNFNENVGEFRYRVVSISIVNPSDVGVLDQSGDEILTLVTCYPFNFVGSAPNRFIVRAVKVG